MLHSLEKHLFYTFLFSIFCSIGYSQNIEAQFDFAQFQNQESSFIETYISINAKSVHFTQNENNTFQASVLINMVFLSQDTIYLADKYLLSSPELKDTTDIDFVFIDGGHTNDQMLKDFDACRAVADPNCVYVFHDVINFQMTQAFKFIAKENQDLSSSLLYRTPSGMGISYPKVWADILVPVVITFSESDQRRVSLWRKFKVKLTGERDS